jgi:hypothetical protein
MFFDPSERRHIRSIMGYRIDEGKQPKMMWLIDASEKDALPDSQNYRDGTALLHFSQIFDTFSARLRYEYTFETAKKLFEKTEI